MNISSYYDKIARIEKDIAEFQKRISDETRKEADKQRQIDSHNRSVNSSTSLSTLQSKQRQIQSYQNDITRIQSAKADLHKKIAERTRDLTKVKLDLQKEEKKESDKIKKEHEDFRKQQEAFQKQQQNFQRDQELLQKRIQSDINYQKEVLNTLIGQIHKHNAGNNSVEFKNYDFFISHATEDKESIVRPLANILITRGHKIWYDEFQLTVGDSLRKKIDEGLIYSKYGIVILSRDFFRKNWTEYELNGLVAKEMNGVKVILPIWHNVTRDEVLKFSPTLADKVALNSAIYSIEEIANELEKLIKP